MSCRQSRQSNETDSVNCATFAAGPATKRPPRETGAVFFLDFTSSEAAEFALKSHVSNQATPAVVTGVSRLSSLLSVELRPDRTPKEESGGVWRIPPLS